MNEEERKKIAENVKNSIFTQEDKNFEEKLKERLNNPKSVHKNNSKINTPSNPAPSDRKRFWLLISFGLMVSMLLIMNFIWFNFNYSGKEPQINVNIPKQNPTINNQYDQNINPTINVHVNMSDEIIKIISDEIINKLNETTNETN